MSDGGRKGDDDPPTRMRVARGRPVSEGPPELAEELRRLEIERVDSLSERLTLAEAERQWLPATLQWPTPLSGGDRAREIVLVARGRRVILGCARMFFLTRKQAVQRGLPKPTGSVAIVERLVAHTAIKDWTPLLYRQVERLVAEAMVRDAVQLFAFCRDADMLRMERFGFRRCGTPVNVDDEGWLNPIEVPLNSDLVRARGGGLTSAVERVTRVKLTLKRRR